MNLLMIHENRIALSVLTRRVLQRTFRGGTGTNAFVPVINRRIGIEVDTLTLMSMDPRPASNIRNAVAIAT